MEAQYSWEDSSQLWFKHWGGGEAAERADQAEVWVVLPFNIEILNPEDLRTI